MVETTTSEQDEAQRAAEEEAAARRIRALMQIRQYPDPALRLRAREVESFDDDLARLVERMTVLMADAHGVGLAATQVGVLQRVFVFAPEEEDEPRALVNPRVVARSEETETEAEGCLSLQGVHVPVERNLEVTLAAADPAGRELTLTLSGIRARVVQHELDHLDGVLIFDRTDLEHRREALAVLRPQPVLSGAR